MRVCKSCHNEMIIVVNFGRPRPLYRPFSHYATAIKLVFKNNEDFSLLKSVNIYSHLGKSIWSPRQQFFSSELKIKVGPRFLVVRVWRIVVNKNKSRGLGWVPKATLLELPLNYRHRYQSVSRHRNLIKLVTWLIFCLITLPNVMGTSMKDVFRQ